jgi:hypothetical protein
MSAPKTTFLTIAGKKTQLTIGGSGPPLLYLHLAGELVSLPVPNLVPEFLSRGGSCLRLRRTI